MSDRIQHAVEIVRQGPRDAESTQSFVLRITGAVLGDGSISPIINDYERSLMKEIAAAYREDASYINSHLSSRLRSALNKLLSEVQS